MNMDEVMSNVTRDANGCFIWTRNLTAAGYAQARFEGKNQYVHRLMYEKFHGPIPARLHLDHTCRVRSCVNPWHLEPVTQAENNRRAVPHRTRAARCRKDLHDLPPFEGKPRHCKPCDRQTQRERRWRQGVKPRRSSLGLAA